MIEVFDLSRATDLDKQKLPIQTVNGVSPDSNGNISITSVSGNAGTATKLKTARTISLSGDATGSASFDGSANKSISVTLASSGVTAGTYNNVTVDAKGRVTAGSNTNFVKTVNGTAADAAGDVTIATGVTITAQSLGVNGYVKYSNGLIIQWGKGNANGSKQTITFPISFSNTNFIFVPSIGNSHGDVNWTEVVDTANTDWTTSTYRTKNTQKIGTHVLQWLAIGY